MSNEVIRSGHLPAPHESIRIRAALYVDERGSSVCVDYWGSFAALVAAGCCGKEHMRPAGAQRAKRRGTSRAGWHWWRFGTDADHMRFTWRLDGIRRALQMPGVGALFPDWRTFAPERVPMPILTRGHLRLIPGGRGTSGVRID